MKIKINRIIDHAQENERVEMSVTENTNLHNWIVADTTYADPTHISNKLKHIQWFLPQAVLTGDQVILYTREGKNRSEKVNSINSRYHVYWQLKISVWNDAGDAVVLININDWSTSKTK